jgi:hypothetical protein
MNPKHAITRVGLLLALLSACSETPPAEAANPNAPDWYRGTEPWSSMPLNVRTELVRLAHEKPPNPPIESRRAEGIIVLNRIRHDYQLRDSVAEATAVGDRMIIWLPDSAWDQLSPNSRENLKAFASSKYSSWGVGVGPVVNGRVIHSRLVVGY